MDTKENTKVKLTFWKCLKDGMKSAHGYTTWNVGEWQTVAGKISACSNGFHCSSRIIDAMGYVYPSFIAKVEVDGESVVEGDKSCHRSMRVVKSWEWTKEDSVSLAIFAAELVLDIFEKKHPDDKRPREAIEAAKAWLLNPTKANAANTANAANAANAAYAAANAAYAAANATANAAKAAAYAAANAAANATNTAYAANYAANATYAAAYAAYAANAANAAYAAANATNAAAYAAISEECEAFIIERLNKKEAAK